MMFELFTLELNLTWDAPMTYTAKHTPFSHPFDHSHSISTFWESANQPPNQRIHITTTTSYKTPTRSSHPKQRPERTIALRVSRRAAPKYYGNSVVKQFGQTGKCICMCMYFRTQCFYESIVCGSWIWSSRCKYYWMR